MLLELKHHTELNYDSWISESVMELRVAPRTEMYQHRLSFDLAVGPPTSVAPYFDWLGNTVHAMQINGFHDHIRIVATTVIEVDRPITPLGLIAESWPMRPPEDYALIDFLDFGGPVQKSDELVALVKEIGIANGTNLGEVFTRMMEFFDRNFAYEKGVTTAASPISEILLHRKGVCQDFTHLFIAVARQLGIPARYVSGLVHPDSDRIRGALQTHAWCELFLPSMGWVAIDPTNKRLVGSNYVTIAVGRDFRDVAPNKGVYRGRAKESIHVEVTSNVLDEVPSELAAERFQAIGLPLFPGWSRDRRFDASAVEEAQQQQQ